MIMTLDKSPVRVLGPLCRSNSKSLNVLVQQGDEMNLKTNNNNNNNNLNKIPFKLQETPTPGGKQQLYNKKPNSFLLKKEKPFFKPKWNHSYSHHSYHQKENVAETPTNTRQQTTNESNQEPSSFSSKKHRNSLFNCLLTTTTPAAPAAPIAPATSSTSAAPPAPPAPTTIIPTPTTITTTPTPQPNLDSTKQQIQQPSLSPKPMTILSHSQNTKSESLQLPLPLQESSCSSKEQDHSNPFRRKKPANTRRWKSLRFSLKNFHFGNHCNPPSTTSTSISTYELWMESLSEEFQEFLVHSDEKRIEYPEYLRPSERKCVIQMARKFNLAVENEDTCLGIYKPMCASPIADGASRPEEVFVNVDQLASKGKESFVKILRLRRLDSASGCRERVLWEAAESAKNEASVKPIEEGDGGVYAMQASDGKKIAMFKPKEEENFVREGLKPGEGAVREEAAYVLDSHSGGFCGVPPTAVAQLNFSKKGQTKHGSIQRFMKSKMGSMADFGMPHDLDKANQFVHLLDIQKIALLDIRLFNTDRHPGNMLLLGDEPPYHVVPIDHGCILPSWFHLAEAKFDWMDYPQAKLPFNSQTLQYIQQLDILSSAKDLRKLRIREECIFTMKICTRLLQIGTAHGMTLYDIGTWMQRTGCLDQPSILETLILQACQTCHIPFQFVLNTYQEKTGYILPGLLSRRPPLRLLHAIEQLIRDKICHNSTQQICHNSTQQICHNSTQQINQNL